MFVQEIPWLYYAALGGWGEILSIHIKDAYWKQRPPQSHGQGHGYGYQGTLKHHPTSAGKVCKRAVSIRVTAEKPD